MVFPRDHVTSIQNWFMNNGPAAEIKGFLALGEMLRRGERGEGEQEEEGDSTDVLICFRLEIFYWCGESLERKLIHYSDFLFTDISCQDSTSS
jgi:hypothetical protein